MPDPTPFPTVTVSPSLHALLAALIDYAGLFPPAGLSMSEAIDHYARYRHDPEAWMLGRFVVPAARLDELAPHVERFTEGPPLDLALLVAGGADLEAFNDALVADLARRRAFLAHHPGRVRADVLEMRLPDVLHRADADALRAFVETVAGHLTADAASPLEAFIEVPLTDASRASRAALLDVLARQADEPVRMSIKVRTGGLEPAAFPPPDALANVIAGCRDRGLRFKATAGLHHPMRLYDATVGAPMYGFLNVFGAAVLAHTHVLDPARLREILLEEQADRLEVTADSLRWRAWEATPADIRSARAELAVSFGSCSFDEPRHDLAALGIR